MIRAITPADVPEIVALTQGTEVFKPHEVEALEEVLADYFTTNHQHGHVAVTCEQEGQVLGYAYYAPAAMTDRSWYLYWIAVRAHVQARGIGARLLHHAEEDIRRHNGRILFIETSSLPHYDKTRKFYLKQKYEVTGVLRDYYCEGDDMVVFRKKL
jgi:ribosomal protein S18 acetylase RimI-like enzyme